MSPAAIHDRISVHSVCFPATDVDALFQAWDAVGAGRVSFSSGQLHDFGPAPVRARLDAGGHRAETITHVFRAGPLAAHADAMAAERALLLRTIDAAAAIGARSVYMLSGGRGAMAWEAAAEVFAAAVAPCLDHARDAGVALAVENTLPLFADLHIGNNLRDTIALAELTGIGLCIDYYACWTEAGMRDLLARAAPRLVVVQASDYVLGDRALPCRAVPGDGAIDWPAVLGWLDALGYRGAFDLELFGPRVDAEGPVAAVRRAAATLGAMLR